MYYENHAKMDWTNASNYYKAISTKTTKPSLQQQQFSQMINFAPF